MADTQPYATVPVGEIIAAGMADIDGRPPFKPAVRLRVKAPRKKRRRVIFGKRDTTPVAPMLDVFLASIGV